MDITKTLDRPYRSEAQAMVDTGRRKEWADTYINVFLDSRDRTPNTESVHFELSDCYQSILDGQSGAQYAYTIQVHVDKDGKRTSTIWEDGKADALAWEAEAEEERRQNPEEFGLAAYR